MMLHSVLFYVFAVIMFGAALGVVFSRNPIHAVMFLVFTFFNAAILWLLAEAEFLAGEHVADVAAMGEYDERRQRGREQP